MKLLFASILVCTLAFAGENDKIHRPLSFKVTNGKAVFVDFTEATYVITYDVPQKKASVRAEIMFNSLEEGFPIFDSVAAPASIELDGKAVTATETKTPESETTLRVINSVAALGQHTLVISLPLMELVDFSNKGVNSAFWTSDLDEREFLERYMPANLEFDQVKMTFLVSFLGQGNDQAIYTNGVQTKLNASTVKITYPSYYTASSIFFHTVPTGTTNEERFTVKSIDGRDIQGVVYTKKDLWGGSNLQKLKEQTIAIFHELESDYGAFPHPSITVYNAGMGGMEYCGATMTSSSALGHELFHSYFARGVMPANGNSGWLDEALASWRDSGYQRLGALSGASRMSSHPYYTRTTDQAAYSFGERFMRYLDGKMSGKGGLKPFMRYMIEKRVFAPIFVEEFIQEMSDFYGISVLDDFKKYTYASQAAVTSPEKSRHPAIHRKMSLAELQQYL